MTGWTMWQTMEFHSYGDAAYCIQASINVNDGRIRFRTRRMNRAGSGGMVIPSLSPTERFMKLHNSVFGADKLLKIE